MYAPTNELMNEEKAVQFYEILHECLSQVPEQDMLLAMENFNARVGTDVASWQGTEQNSNGVK